MRIPLYLMAPVLLAAACSTAPSSLSKEEEAFVSTADSTNLANDITALNSPSRKRVRTADVRCRVSNVFSSLSALEHTVIGVGGMVGESTMHNDVAMTQDLPYSVDSLKRVQLYTPTATLTLRVPAASLDSVVHTLTSMATFIDYRTMKDEDKTLLYLSNSLKNDAPEPAVLKPTAKGTALDVATYQDQRYDEGTNRRIANLAILDDVHYATFSVQLFQPQQADIQVIVNPDKVTRAGFGTRILTALVAGTETLSNVFVFLLSCWPFLIVVVAGWFGYRRMMVRH
ncbi:DUF4349 domain-containing protein [Chitinophaga filiformis]|uniref:DUF4349 domain-containing protein n=1 Tax=Chitinophaga filiformis TaxID=104663 RepID=UPI001F3CEA1A|nr:DUF4349 domain-containing protein [Chitinophaga filiformis]MCF6403016.1 DUF4349 domain-containing protein [Chitinophaga filiformis]